MFLRNKYVRFTVKFYVYILHFAPDLNLPVVSERAILATRGVFDPTLWLKIFTGNNFLQFYLIEAMLIRPNLYFLPTIF